MAIHWKLSRLIMEIMVPPEKIPDVKRFPLLPRVQTPPDSPPLTTRGKTGRSLTPMNKTKVEFREARKPEPEKKPSARTKPASGATYAKHADRVGMLLGLATILVLVLIAGFFVYSGSKLKRLNNAASPGITLDPSEIAFPRKAVQDSVKLRASSDWEAPSLARKIDRVRAELKSERGAGDDSVVTDDLEISRQEQIEAMNRKLEKMRAEKLAAEPPEAESIQRDLVSPVGKEDSTAPQGGDSNPLKSLQ
jgi:hypothetical protein